MRSGQITKAYMEVCCARCAHWESTLEYTLPWSERRLLAAGWRKKPEIDWVCPACDKALKTEENKDGGSSDT